jgi:hypothetical protein
MPSKQAGEQFLQAFVDRDYKGCLLHFAEIQKAAPGSELEMLLLPMQIVLICHQRLGLADLAESLGASLLAMRQCVSQFVDMDVLSRRLLWEAELLKLTLGQAELAGVLVLAQMDGERCQAHYYAGARHLTKGDLAKARAAFDACLAIQDDCIERRLAEAERQLLTKSSAGPSRRPSPERRN